ncbi:MAG: universal stress protein [Cyanobacteria bacterium]|nr:universal stress protein [Cyanobacteriota bacterium]MDW8202808.1 universal stress protein [Cyanobacteriota bacterium SKYGB_h_bin112]
MFQRFLVSTDLTDGAYRLLTCLPALASAGVKTIVFLHVVPLGSDDGVPRVDEEKVERARQLLNAGLEKTDMTIEATIDIRTGNPSEAILKAIQVHDPQVVLLGKPVSSFLNEKLFGSTTTKLAQQIKIPLLVMRPQLVMAFTQDELTLRCQHLFRTLLIPCDGSETFQQLLRRLSNCLQETTAKIPERIVLCRVIEEGRYQSLSQAESQKQAEEQLSTAKALLADVMALGVQVDVSIRQGNPVVEVMQAAFEVDATAIVISSKNVGKIWELSVPSVAGELLRQCWRPVLFFPPVS